MGMDVAFSLSKAQEKGIIELARMRNGTEERVQECLADGYPEDDDHILWLREEEDVMRLAKLPVSLLFACKSMQDDAKAWRRCEINGDTIIVRANKWGSLYSSLTSQLKEYGIEWTEA